MVKKQEKNEKKPQKCEEKVGILESAELSTYPQASKTAVKLITAYTPEGLESIINDWLDHADDCQIVDIKLSCFPGPRVIYNALIIFTFTEEDQADD